MWPRKYVDMSSYRNKVKLILSRYSQNMEYKPFLKSPILLIPNNLQEYAYSCKSTGEALKLALLQSPAVSTTFPSFVNHGQALKTVEIVPDIGLPLKIVEVRMR
ncbi:hypothetical protein Bca52824_023125 [Brassica carinata]|uniref:Uncharacterized protein n=1 Tax=Brassica carinata TaxID=52824 RepID=A0A8X7VHA1_BRACI|nr:hypothetical protein Bca52824_023125 [Brassica carinata]